LDVEDDDDMLSAMARELVEKDAIGETADAVWALCRSRNNAHYVEPKAMPSWPPPALDNTACAHTKEAVQLALF